MTEAKMQADEIQTALSSALEHMDALIEAIAENIEPVYRCDVAPEPVKVNLGRALQLIEIAHIILDSAQAADEQWQKVFEAL